MTCSTCDGEFPGLVSADSSHVSCGLCKQLHGKSENEKQMIRVRHSFKSIGTNKQLTQIIHGSEDSPVQLLWACIPRIANTIVQQVYSDNWSAFCSLYVSRGLGYLTPSHLHPAQFAGLVNTATASTALDIAAVYKAKASDTRIGLPLNANLVAASKAKAVVAERAAAKQAFEGNYIRIDALLFKLSKVRDQERLIEVSTRHYRWQWNLMIHQYQISKLRTSKAFGPTSPISSAIYNLMEKIQADFAEDFPNSPLITKYILLIVMSSLFIYL
jgi:hypothetical protein